MQRNVTIKWWSEDNNVDGYQEKDCSFALNVWKNNK